jgi:hypothetical protein
MIRPLRRVHRIVMMLLSIILPLIVFTALAVRREW